MSCPSFSGTGGSRELQVRMVIHAWALALTNGRMVSFSGSRALVPMDSDGLRWFWFSAPTEKNLKAYHWWVWRGFSPSFFSFSFYLPLSLSFSLFLSTRRLSRHRGPLIHAASPLSLGLLYGLAFMNRILISPMFPQVCECAQPG